MSDGTSYKGIRQIPLELRRVFTVLFIIGFMLNLCGCAAPGKFFSYKGKKANVLTFDYSDPSARNPKPYFKYAYQNPLIYGYETGSYNAPLLKLTGSGTLSSVATGTDGIAKTYIVTLSGRAQVRNAILFELMGVIDDYYGDFADGLLNGRTSKDLAADIIGLGTSAASTASGEVGLKTILSAISTGVQGVSTSIDKDFLLNQSLEAIKASMDSERNRVGTSIYLRMRKDVVAYPLEAGLRDIIRYYYAGTVTSGLEKLATTSAADKSAQQQQETQASPGGSSPGAKTDKPASDVGTDIGTSAAPATNVDASVNSGVGGSPQGGAATVAPHGSGGATHARNPN